MQPEQVTLALFDPPLPSLDNFVAGENAAALAAARAVGAGRGSEFLHLWGPGGSGRSHLLQAMDPQADAGVPAFRPGRLVYAVDDVERLGADAQARLFELQLAVRDARVSGLAATLVTAADAAPAFLPLREDVRTRLAWGLVFCLKPLAEADVRAALQVRAQALGVQLEADLLDYMLARLPRDLRSLIALVEALDRFALARQRALTIPLLRQWLQERATAGPAAP